MDIFWRLLLGHFLSDFTLQSDFIAAWKRKSRAGMFVHCVTHPIVYAALCWPLLGQTWIKTPHLQAAGWTTVLILFVLHYATDAWRALWITRGWLPDNMAFFAGDQFIHWLCICALLPLGLLDRGTAWLPEPGVVIACLAVGVTHFTTVAVYYAEKSLWNGIYPHTEEKYHGMAERLVFWVCWLLPGWSCLPAAALWAAAAYQFRLRLNLDYSWFAYWTGGAMALAAGLAARAVWHL